ncbi:hypothetical protein D5085_02560 [Ectothiorhodospiraceae bacterium BW-2]|nr:hypothetical protein D5085_02560 [Ectothiorhodospiraceae bacterium BW-2]
MIENVASITHIEGEYAWLEAERQGGCQSCRGGDSCSTSVLAKLFGGQSSRFRVRNSLGLGVGEQVVVGIEERTLLLSSLLLYLLPLLLLLLFAAIGERVGGSEPYAVVGALLGLMAGLLLVRVAGRLLSGWLPLEAVMLRRSLPTPFLMPINSIKE